VLAEQLGKYVGGEVQAAILEGMDYANSGSKAEVKTEWARELMRRMDQQLDPQDSIRVREGCACVLSNEKSIYARTFRRLRELYPDDDQYLDEVVRYLNATAPLRRCGEVSREGERIYSVIARERCECSVLRAGLRQPISVTWCHCSKGSLLSVYRHVFPEKHCVMEILSTIASGGEECRFVTTYHEEIG
jgi:hypothetical protein